MSIRLRGTPHTQRRRPHLSFLRPVPIVDVAGKVTDPPPAHLSADCSPTTVPAPSPGRAESRGSLVRYRAPTDGSSGSSGRGDQFRGHGMGPESGRTRGPTLSREQATVRRPHGQWTFDRRWALLVGLLAFLAVRREPVPTLCRSAPRDSFEEGCELHSLFPGNRVLKPSEFFLVSRRAHLDKILVLPACTSASFPCGRHNSDYGPVGERQAGCRYGWLSVLFAEELLCTGFRLSHQVDLPLVRLLALHSPPRTHCTP